MQTVNHQNAITLNEAAKRLAVGGRKPSFTTMWRWATKGIRGVRLEYARIGRRIVTSPAAIDQFMQELAAADCGKPYRPIVDHDQIEAEAEALGV